MAAQTSKPNFTARLEGQGSGQLAVINRSAVTPNISVISVTVYIVGIDQLSRLFSKLENVDGIVNVSTSRKLVAAKS